MGVPPPDPAALGPLAPLIGEWEGDQGSDDAYVYARGREESAPFRELSSFTPAGPAHNGAQALYIEIGVLDLQRIEGPLHQIDIAREREFALL